MAFVRLCVGPQLTLVALYSSHVCRPQSISNSISVLILRFAPPIYCSCSSNIRHSPYTVATRGEEWIWQLNDDMNAMVGQVCAYWNAFVP